MYGKFFSVKLSSASPISNRVDTTTIILSIDIMLCSVFYRLFESSEFSKWDIKKLDSIFFRIFVTHFEELFEIFFWAGIETRCIERDIESFCEFCCYIHPHIITVCAFFSFFRSILESSDPREKILHIICPLNIRDILDLTNSNKCFISLIVLCLGLDIGIIPETDHIIFITKLKDWHCHIWTATDMNQDFWFFNLFWEIEFILENIL